MTLDFDISHKATCKTPELHLTRTQTSHLIRQVDADAANIHFYFYFCLDSHLNCDTEKEANPSPLYGGNCSTCNAVTLMLEILWNVRESARGILIGEQFMGTVVINRLHSRALLQMPRPHNLTVLNRIKTLLSMPVEL